MFKILFRTSDNAEMDNFTNNFQTPIYQGGDILKLIPQRPPMVMVDKFFGIEENHSFSGLTISSDNLLCENGILLEEGIIEHFAQSAAARIGYIFLQNEEVVPIGFIGAVSKFSIYALPAVESEIRTIVSIVQEVGDITLARAKSWVDDRLIADGELKIYLKRD